MFEYWTTNKNLDIEFNVEHVNERILNIRVRNRNYRVSLPLGNRSKGFLWFFSFLIWFSKIQGDKNKKYILLLDEPGLSLHASAQDDLLRFIDEKLSVDYQINHSSPKMIYIHLDTVDLSSLSSILLHTLLNFSFPSVNIRIWRELES